MNEIETYPSILNLVTDIVSAYLANNRVPPEFIPVLIRQTHQALTQPQKTHVTNKLVENKSEPAVPIEDSISLDHIVCLEDGKKLKMLKRHLMSDHGLTPDEYKRRWNLAPDYPMVAPNYAEKRSKLARQIRLGHTKDSLDN